MPSTVRIGRALYGASTLTLGLYMILGLAYFVNFAFSWMRLVDVLKPSSVWNSLVGPAVIGSLLIIYARRFLTDRDGAGARRAATAIGAMFLFLVVFVHLPILLFRDANHADQAAWLNTARVTALAGAAFVVANGYPESTESTAFARALSRMVPSGRRLFGLMIAVFALQYARAALSGDSLLPSWIPRRHDILALVPGLEPQGFVVIDAEEGLTQFLAICGAALAFVGARKKKPA